MEKKKNWKLKKKKKNEENSVHITECKITHKSHAINFAKNQWA